MIRILKFCLLAAILIVTPTNQLHAAGEQEDYTYTLTESNAAYTLWTAPPSERIFKNTVPPSDTTSGIKVYAAKNEFEPFQVVVNPALSDNLTVTAPNFGSGITTEIYQVKYVNIALATDSLGQTGPYPDPLWPIANGVPVSVTSGENTAFWFSVFVPKTAAPGDYIANAQIGGVNIPVTLHVFNFVLPDDLHVKSQMNFSHQTILNAYSVSGTGTEYWKYVDAMKQYFIDHRLTPKSVLWSGGLTSMTAPDGSYIDYDCNSNISDPEGIWGFEQPAERYLDGTGLMSGTFLQPFNSGTGFPSFMAATFRNNDSSQDQRPDTFCGHTRTSADWYTANNPNSAYNSEWFEYMTALQTYLAGKGYLDEAYYYFANEPQDQADYDAIAWYSRYTSAAAPNLKLMVSEEPKGEIYNHANYVANGQIDIWLPVLNNYDPVISHDREKDYGEETWIYFLHGTRPPYFNPITLDHPGIESKFTGWFLWKYRVRGIAYYSLNNWSKNPWTDPMTDGHNGDTFMLYPPSENNTPITYGANNHRFVPSIRFELMRDSLEDYEYLYLLAGGQPQVNVTNSADPQADKIISGLTSYTRHNDFIYNLRRVIGLKVGNEISSIPDIEPPAGHPRTEGSPQNYYLNFQNPTGEPTADPLVVNGRTYMKIGWNEYEADTSLGYGWYGDMAHTMYQYTSSAPNVLQGSIIYDDWGRQKTFEFDLPNGRYNATVSVGWQGRTYAHNKIDIEGVSFVDDEATLPYIVRTKEVTINDNKLTMQMGIFDEYTMLNYLNIEAIPMGITDAAITNIITGTNSLTAALGWTPLTGAVTTTVRYATTPITDETAWSNAATLTDTLVGGNNYVAVITPFDSNATYYITLKSQNETGEWSNLSNLIFWPQKKIYLPLVLKE